MNIKKLDSKSLCRELSIGEAQNVYGGGILDIFGLSDGIKGNTEVYIFCIRVYHGKNAGSPRH